MWEELPLFWDWLSEFVKSPRTAFATTSRLVAEQVYSQIGARPEYVPMVMLHTRGIRWRPSVNEVFVYKCSHPAFESFWSKLTKAATGSGLRLVFHSELQKAAGRPLKYSEIASFRAVVLMPRSARARVRRIPTPRQQKSS